MPSSSEEARSFPTSGLQTIEANQIVEEEKLYGYRADRFFAVQMEEAFQERYQTVANLEFWFVINYLANSGSERPSICRRESAFEGREIPDPTLVPVRDDRPNHPSLLELLGGDITGCNAEQLRVKLQWHNNNKNLPDMAIHELQTINEDAMRDVERDLGANTLLVIEFGALRGTDIAISTLSWHQTTEDISNKFLNSSSLPNSKRDLHLSACEGMVEKNNLDQDQSIDRDTQVVILTKGHLTGSSLDVALQSPKKPVLDGVCSCNGQAPPVYPVERCPRREQKSGMNPVFKTSDEAYKLMNPCCTQ
ncbi:uncharacterized protein BDW43DRAFT_310672 [Aspergillus alliaceus]|uniref:uncharacterized protein n=1 Tax=Petromyces alliaceus TaxID=209559 RepID=UPI0012A5863D|nr:uncharacterized protein BDW43DRAFT_310672 [Aspergillus alliaceus]KAB8233997.1 hypothetical protein BDW43DRAFT_310672 [Aspergillus alliaceus]